MTPSCKWPLSTRYEFKVVAFNASGSSAASAASLPIQTGAAPASPAKSAAAAQAAAAAAAVTAEMHLKSPKRTDSENKLIEREEPELLSRYAQVSLGYEGG